SGLPPKGAGVTKHIKVLSGANGRIYGGMNFGDGTGMPYYSSDMGETWNQDTLGAPAHALGWAGLPAVSDIYTWGHWVYVSWDSPNAYDIKTFDGPFTRNTFMSSGINHPQGRCAKGDTLFIASNKFYYTVDGGATFTTPANTGYPSVGGQLLIDGKRIYMIGREVWNGPFYIYYTEDNGENWVKIDVTSLSSRKDIGGTYYKQSAYFIKDNNMWFAFGMDKFDAPPNIWRSTDLGATWSPDTLGIPKSYVNGATGFAYSNDGTLWCAPSYQDIYKQKIDAGTGGGNNVTVAPGLLLPPDMQQISGTDATLVWGSVPNAVKYHLQVATDAAFTTIITDDATLTDTSKTITSLGANTTYYWRVSGISSEGQAGPWAGMRSFITMASGVASEEHSNISISPNPASDHLTIEFGTAQVSSVDIYDILGNHVLHSDAQGITKLVLPVSNFVPGSYTVRINDKNTGIAIRRILIQ
ncbi:MAG TPA: T9SS type A sorting domain-containing protein, partial [Candidatus Kapabacteria bacterium]